MISFYHEQLMRKILYIDCEAFKIDSTREIHRRDLETAR